MKTWLLLALAAAGPAGAQARTSIGPGMTEADVRRVFGEPTVRRQAADRTYLFYANGCPVRCGSDDVVFLEADRVIAAVLRTPARHFAGPAVLGSPPPSGGTPSPRRAERPLRSEGIEVQVPGSARTTVGAKRPARRIVVGRRDGELAAPADGFRTRRSATTDTIRGPLQRADTAAALSPPAPVPGTPPASGTPARPQPQPPRPPE